MDNLITLYRELLALPHANFLRVDHDEAMVAIVYKVIQSNAEPLILKICSRPKDYLREVYFLKFFADKLPVPHIIQHIPPEANVYGAVLMECLPGTLLKITEFSDELAYELGALLARIHLNRVSGYGDLTQPEDLNPDPRVHYTWKFEESLEECRDHLPIALMEQCRLYYDKNVNLLNSVDGPCIIHRDFRAGNVIVDGGKIKGVIDWSSGRASFAEDDFCFMEHWEWPTNSTNKKSFLEGYASIRPVPDYNAIMPLLRLNRAIATIGFTVKRGTWENSNSRVYQSNRQFLETFFRNL
jgi:Ser/Thr protein kinase RdoA (MazF antagonist)